MTDVEHMKWWGWGVEGVGFHHEDKPGFAPFVLDAVGLDLATARPVGQPDFAELTLADPIVPDAFREALVDIVGPDFVTSDPMERVVHSYGKSLRDLVRIRSNRVERAVDLVVYPADEDDVQRIVD
ncbi:MAG TPA: FAD-binding oxidoreductase, partial [Protaetiibacter sp.]|nr:FAD-binding oxidoreductase [Protaetiibacter sp.]